MPKRKVFTSVLGLVLISISLIGVGIFVRNTLLDQSPGRSGASGERPCRLWEELALVKPGDPYLPRCLKILEVVYVPPASGFSDANESLITETRRVFRDILLPYTSSYHGDLNGRVIFPYAIHPGFVRRTARPAPTTGAGDIEKMYSSLVQIMNDKSGSLTGNSESICDVVVHNDIDQVWLWVDPIDGVPGREYLSFGGTSNYAEHETLSQLFGTLCTGTNKSLAVMGFDYTRAPENALHSFAHFYESFLNSLQGELFNIYFRGTIAVNATDEKKITDSAPALEKICGSVHVPPNVLPDPTTGVYKGYQYTYPNTATANTCWNWKPDGTGAAQSVSSDTWNSKTVSGYDGITDDGKYLVWWLQNFPNFNSVLLEYSGKVVPNWWDFVADTDEVIRYYMDNTYNGKSYFLRSTLNRPAEESTSAVKDEREGSTTTTLTL